jgi:hypothetical protein
MSDEDFERCENRYKRRWILKNAGNLNLDSDDTDQMFLYYIKSIWSDSGVQNFIKEHFDQELKSARYL